MYYVLKVNVLSCKYSDFFLLSLTSWENADSADSSIKCNGVTKVMQGFLFTFVE